MRVSLSQKICGEFCLGLSFTSTMAIGETYENEWTDLNYSMCDGIGLHSSGKVRVRVEYDIIPQGYGVSSFQVFTTHPRGSFPAAVLTYENLSGENEVLQLVQPWFPTVGEQQTGHLLLPRVMTSQGVSGPQEQMQIKVLDRGNLEIDVSLLVDGFGACATGFSRTFVLLP